MQRLLFLTSSVVLPVLSLISQASAAVPQFLTLPFADENVVLQQGWVYSEELRGSTKHEGIDYIRGEVGSDSSTWTSFDVHAAADGVAMESVQPSVGENIGYGRFVIIRHNETDDQGRHYFTLYAHLMDVESNIPVRPKRDTDFDSWFPVRGGKKIGEAGDSGIPKVIHLHFEVNRRGYAENRTDPYDIEMTREFYVSCGPDFLWTQCPPVFPTPSSEPVQTIGMVVDDQTDIVTVFNADTDTVLGTVPIGGLTNGDCSITADQTLGFATDFSFNVWVIDLTTIPPSLAAGTNPIPISNHGEDTSISPDQQFLAVCDGSVPQPISVIDIASRTEISTFALDIDCNSVDICSDESVLVTSFHNRNVRRLIIDGAGNLTDTGEVLIIDGGGSNTSPNNVFCAPGGESGIVIRRGPQEILSFTIPGLNLVDTRTLSGTELTGISGQINPAGDLAFARSNGGAVDAFTYNSATGALGITPLFTIPIANTITFFGMDQMALNPDGTKLYVSQPAALNVYDSSTGTLLTSIADPNIVEPTGVCFASN